MQPQWYDWTCSTCALDWVIRSVGLDPAYNRVKAVYDVGYPNNVNPQYGLMDASGSALRGVYGSYGQETLQGWLDFDTVYERALSTTGQMSGAAWYHWVALRGTSGPNLWIANSAPGYKGIHDILTRADFNRLGPFSVVLLN